MSSDTWLKLWSSNQFLNSLFWAFKPCSLLWLQLLDQRNNCRSSG